MADELVKMADKVLRLSIRNVPLALWRRVRLLAIQRNVAVSKIIVEALERYLETEKKCP